MVVISLSCSNITFNCSGYHFRVKLSITTHETLVSSSSGRRNSGVTGRETVRKVVWRPFQAGVTLLKKTGSDPRALEDRGSGIRSASLRGLFSEEIAGFKQIAKVKNLEVSWLDFWNEAMQIYPVSAIHSRV